jgi:ferredoxin
MTYKITDDCTKCGDCIDECPVECITEGAEKVEIDADECIDCGSCAEVCPVDAPQAED